MAEDSSPGVFPAFLSLLRNVSGLVICADEIGVAARLPETPGDFRKDTTAAPAEKIMETVWRAADTHCFARRRRDFQRDATQRKIQALKCGRAALIFSWQFPSLCPGCSPFQGIFLEEQAARRSTIVLNDSPWSQDERRLR